MPISSNKSKSKTTTIPRKKAVKSKSASLSVDVVDITGKKKGTVALPKELFAVPANDALIAQAVQVYLSNRRQPSAVVKTRGEVTGSGRKIYRQKGTGRARHGDRYAGIFVGGGKAHGPRPRTFEKKLSRKMKQKALAMALTRQHAGNRIIVVDGFESIEPKTKLFVTALDTLTGNIKQGKALEKILVAADEKAATLYRAGRNVINVSIREARLLNVYDVINAKRIIFTKHAVERMAQHSK